MKQEYKNKEVSVAVQNVIDSNRTPNVNNNNVREVTKNISLVTVQENLVNWKWVVIDQIKFKDFPIPCIIRDNDPIKEYVSVRIIETVILSNFEPCLSDEAKKFGNLIKYPCTTDEIKTLNDINQNHVDKLYGKETFKYNTDFLVSLEQFLKFYEIIQRTVPLKTNSYENIMKKIIQNGELTQQARPQNILPFNNLRSTNNSYQQMVSNYQMNLNQPMMHRLPNYSHYNICNTSNYQNSRNQLMNYTHINILNPNLINKIHSNQINPMQYQVLQLSTSAPRQHLAQNSNQINNIQTLNENVNKYVSNNFNSNSISNSISNSNSNSNNNDNINSNNTKKINHLIKTNIPQSSSTITTPIQNITVRNLTPPLTPLLSQMTASQAYDASSLCKLNNKKKDSNQTCQNDKNKEKDKNLLDTSTDIFLIDDDETNKISDNFVLNESAIDFSDETYGFLQVNDKILLYIDVEDAFYRYNRFLPKCKKHVLLIHLMSHLNINSELNLRKSLKIKTIDNNAQIKNLIKWFNQYHAPMSLDLILDAKIELVNIMQFQNVYAKEAIFFKNLYYFNQPGIDYFAEYTNILRLQGGFVYVPIENKRNIRPFFQLGDKRLVSCNLTDLICKSVDSSECQIESEKISFDLRKDFKLIDEINEFYRLLIFYFSLNTTKDFFTKKNTFYFNLNKWLDSFPNNFKILCIFNSNFPKTWLNDLNNMENQSRTKLVNSEQSALQPFQSNNSNYQNAVDETDEDESVYMSPQSDDQPIKTISIAILNNQKNSIKFSQEDLNHKPRLRSYSETSVLLKFSNKFKNKNKQLIKYKYLYNRRNSCTILQFLKNDKTDKNLIKINKNQLFNYMDEIIEKKQIEKKLNTITSIAKNNKSNILIKEEKNEVSQSDSRPTQIETCQKESLICEPMLEPTIESLTKELELKNKSNSFNLSGKSTFLTDPSSASSSPSTFSLKSKEKKTLKRKKTKFKDDFSKRARFVLDDKECKKSTDFIFSDYRNLSVKTNEKQILKRKKAKIKKDFRKQDLCLPLKTNDHFNFKYDVFPKKSTEPKNITLIEENLNELYSNDVANESYYIKKYNIYENSRVVVDKIDIGQFLKNKNEIKNKKKIGLKQNKSDKSITTLKINNISNNSSKISLNEESKKKQTVEKIISLNDSDDENELPRLDLDFINP